MPANRAIPPTTLRTICHRRFSRENTPSYAAAARTPAVVNRRAMPRFMTTSFTPFAGYDVDGDREVAVITDIHKVPGRLAKTQVTGNR